jgi:dipeptidyl aminopeptidase/acylaminoacyl peptidase
MSRERNGESTKDLAARLGDPKTDREKLRAVSPVNHADRVQAPLLLAYGATDQRVPLIHGNEMKAALDRAHKDYEWVVYSDQQHTSFSPENRVDFYGRVEAFLAKNLAPRPPVTTSSAAAPQPATVQ